MRGGRADDPQPFRAGDRRFIGSVDRDLVECELSGDDFLNGGEGVALSHQETEVLVGILGLGSPCVFDHAGLLRGDHQREKQHLSASLGHLRHLLGQLSAG